MFSLLYGTLRKSMLFGKVETAEKIYIVLAFVLTFFYLYNLSVIGLTQRVLSFFFYEMLAVLLILIALSFLFTAVSPKGEGSPKTSVLSGIFGFLVILAFLYASITSPSEVGESISSFMGGIWLFLVTSGLLIILIPLGIIIAVIYWVTSPPKKGTPVKDKAKNFLVITDATLEDLYKRLRGQ